MVWDVVISHKGDRLAWLTQTLGETSWGDVKLYVTELNGEDRQEIGRSEPEIRNTDARSTGIEMRRPEGIMWSPNDEHIGFFYGGQFRTVVAPVPLTA